MAGRLLQNYLKVSTIQELQEVASKDPGHLVLAYVRLQLLEKYFLKGNSKKHDLQLIKDSIYRHGFKDPMKFDPNLTNEAGNKGAIQEGNGRLEDLLYVFNNKLDAPFGVVVFEDSWYVPLLFGVNDKTEADAIAYSVSHNLSALWGSDMSIVDMSGIFDQDLLIQQLEDLAAESIDLLPVGIDGDDLDLLLAIGDDNEPGKSHQEDQEAVNDLLDKAADGKIDSRVKLGEIWQLGRHKLCCADSTLEQNYIKLLDGKSIDLLFTDPPYGVSYADKNKSLNETGRGNRIQTPIANDHLSPQETFDNLWLPCFSALFNTAKPGCSYYICCPQGGEFQYLVMKALDQAGWPLKHQLIWVKNNHVLGRADYHYKHEPILYGWKAGDSHYFRDSRSEMSVWNFDKPLKSDLHPTMKPVELVQYAMLNSSKHNELVFDAFLGSGTTLIAAETMEGNRSVYGFELSPHYCEVIIQRWETLTGKSASIYGNI